MRHSSTRYPGSTASPSGSGSTDAGASACADASDGAIAGAAVELLAAPEPSTLRGGGEVSTRALHTEAWDDGLPLHVRQHTTIRAVLPHPFEHSGPVWGVTPACLPNNKDTASRTFHWLFRSDRSAESRVKPISCRSNTSESPNALRHGILKCQMQTNAYN